MLQVNAYQEFVEPVDNAAWPATVKQLSRFPLFGMHPDFWDTAKSLGLTAAISTTPSAKERIEKFHYNVHTAADRIKYRYAQRLGIVMNRARNRAALDIALRHTLEEDSVLVLVNQVDHGQAIADRIPGAVCCYSEMGRSKRRAAIQGFSDGSIPCMVATSLADEGLDVPRANVLVLVSGGRSKGKVEQRTGRVLRAFAGKKVGIVYDFLDVGHYFLNAQSRARITTYKACGYNVIEPPPLRSRSSVQLPEVCVQGDMFKK
jgi:superfamily II DNA or RNA helicase